MNVYVKILIFMIFFSCSALSPQRTNYISFEKRKFLGEKIFVQPIKTVDANEKSITIKYTFKGAKLFVKKHDEDFYDIINIKGFNKLRKYGSPALPTNIDFINIPSAASYEIHILKETFVEYEGFYIFPSPGDIIDVYGARVPKFFLDKKIYSCDEFYPSSVLIFDSMQKSYSKKILKMKICPVLFNPVKKTVRVYSEILYRVDFKY